jgi:hypothetical protein
MFMDWREATGMATAIEHQFGRGGAGGPVLVSLSASGRGLAKLVGGGEGAENVPEGEGEELESEYSNQNAVESAAMLRRSEAQAAPQRHAGGGSPRRHTFRWYHHSCY